VDRREADRVPAALLRAVVRVLAAAVLAALADLRAAVLVSLADLRAVVFAVVVGFVAPALLVVAIACLTPLQWFSDGSWFACDIEHMFVNRPRGRVTVLSRRWRAEGARDRGRPVAASCSAR
jgi:hypothetical protein